MTQSVAKRFNDWADAGRGERMAKGHWPITEQILARMGLAPGMICLDVGCGSGYAVREMAERVTHSGAAIGVDLAPRMIALAENNINNPPQVEFAVAEAHDLPFDDARFDRILSVEVLYYLPDMAAALAEMRRMLKPGGSLWVMVDYYAENPYSRNWADYLELPLERLGETGYQQRFEAAGFESVRTERIYNPTPVDEAAFQPGWGYDTPDDVCRFRSEVGSLLVTGQKP